MFLENLIDGSTSQPAFLLGALSCGDDRLGQRRQPHLAPPIVYQIGILDRWPRAELTIFVPSPVSAVPLMPSLEVSNPILQLGELGRLGFALFDGRTVQLPAPTDERGVGDVVLSDQNRSRRAVPADELMARPATELIEDLGEAVAVAAVNRSHLRVIAPEELARLGEAVSNGQVLSRQPCQFARQLRMFHGQNLAAFPGLIAGKPCRVTPRGLGRLHLMPT